MKEVRRALGDVRRILRGVKPGLERYDRLFYQAVIARDPKYGFLKFVAAVGVGGLRLTWEEAKRLALEFIRARKAFLRYEPRGTPIRDMRFRPTKHPHKFVGSREELKAVMARVREEREKRENIRRYLEGMGGYGSMESSYPITYYSDVDVYV